MTVQSIAKRSLQVAKKFGVYFYLLTKYRINIDTAIFHQHYIKIENMISKHHTKTQYTQSYILWCLHNEALPSYSHSFYIHTNNLGCTRIQFLLCRNLWHFLQIRFQFRWQLRARFVLEFIKSMSTKFSRPFHAEVFDSCRTWHYVTSSGTCEL